MRRLSQFGVSFSQNIFAAKQQHPLEAQLWHNLSLSTGHILPRSHLIAQVQNLGDLDCLLRAMEPEVLDFINSQREACSLTPEALALTHILLLSRLWIYDAYEIVRTINEANNYTPQSSWYEPYCLLTLVRVPLAKHQLPHEGKISAPVEMTTFQTELDKTLPLENFVHTLTYDPKDKLRSHIPVTAACTQTGSLQWLCIDFKERRQLWVSRRQIADLILNIKGSNSNI